MKDSYLDDCPDYLENYLTYIRVIQDRADRTEEAYYIDLRTFLRYLKIKNKLCPKDTEWGEITIADTPFELVKKFTLNDAHQYLYYLKNVRDNSTATRSRKCSALKQFYSYLFSKAHLISENPVADLELPRVKNKSPRFLTLEQSMQMLQSIDSKHPERDYCIICLFLNCGMRLSELVGLNLIDFSEENQTLRLFGKGSKERIVYLNDACMEAMRSYLNIRYTIQSNDNAMFLSERKTRITRRRVQQIVEEILVGGYS